MNIGAGRRALWQALRTSTSGGGGSGGGVLPSAISGLSGWWDASDPLTSLDPGGQPILGWNSLVASLLDKSAHGVPLTLCSFANTAGLPAATPRLSGLLGGLGRVAGGASTLAPALDPDLGFQVPNVSLGASLSWTRYLVWSRPNWRQNSGRDSNPITLISSSGTPVLQADSAAGQNRLLLFPGGVSQTILATAMTRRHTHSIILRNSPGAGVDVWLDSTRVAGNVANPISTLNTVPMILLHDTTLLGGAQCWFHEAATWERALSDGEISTLLQSATRWVRGARRGIYLLPKPAEPEPISLV
jgi:hypothetical protein